MSLAQQETAEIQERNSLIEYALETLLVNHADKLANPSALGNGLAEWTQATAMLNIPCPDTAASVAGSRAAQIEAALRTLVNNHNAKMLKTSAPGNQPEDWVRAVAAMQLPCDAVA